ncbi:MAG TPA: hypothetical protein VFV68_03080 [Agriterribacter sp.]|nr:hypothetical protein [Agriterribacter sp.]
MKNGIQFLALLYLFVACKETSQQYSGVEIIKVNMALLDSIRNNSDTGFTRIIGAKEFYSAEQYFSAKDSVVSKIMKDTAGQITGFVQFSRNIRTAYAEYYPNGQLKGKLLLDDQGRFEGPAAYYYQDGRIKSEGVYSEGFFSGTWKNYSPEGKLISTDEYDADGQLTRSVKAE